jgi:hypothetical protein
MKLVSRRVVITFATVAIALVAGSTSANHSWNGYHWARTTSEFTLLTGDNVDSKWDAYLDEAIGDWNQSSVITLKEVAGGTRPRTCKPTAGRIEVCNASYGFNGWLGIAQIWLSGSHITQAITKLNDSYFSTSTYNKPEWRRLVTCQELAHDFGLDHQDENFDNTNLGSCMDYTSKPLGPPSNEHPNSHDFSMISSIYQHLDNGTTVGTASTPAGAPAAMNQIDFDGPGQWGRLVRSSRNGRVQLYELDFGKGHKVVTHVFWADPEADAH